MLKWLFAAALWAAFSMPAQAATYTMDPPKKYNKPFRGTVTVVELSSWSLFFSCRWTISCTIVGGDAPGRCVIRIARPGVWVPGYGSIQSKAYRNALIRHEIGHCNGWPADHPGGVWRKIS
jgi:hypothetical protein